MRIRSIKPEFWRSFSIATLSEPAVILAVGVLNMADDRGYFEADPRVVKSDVFPLREPSRSIPGLLSELVGIGYVALRVAENGRLVGHVVNFERHQVINKKAKHASKAETDFGNGTEALEFTKVPESPKLAFQEHSGSTPVVLPEDSRKNPAGTGNREQGKGTGNPPHPESGKPPQDDDQDSPDKRMEPSPEGNLFVEWFLQLLDRTEAPKPKLTIPAKSNWAIAYDRMLRIDGRTKDEVKAVCQWARSDSFWRKNFLSPIKLRERKDGVQYFDLFLSQMHAKPATDSKKTPTVWELQQRETAIRARMAELKDGHAGQTYVGITAGRTSAWEWTEEGSAEWDTLQAELKSIRALLAANPDRAA